MKKNYLLIVALFAGLFAKSQDTIRFESFNLAVDSFWNGSDRSGGFTDNSTTLPFTFRNNYDTTYQSWDGFAYSTMRDTLTADYTNQYSCIAGEGANSSQTYVVGYHGYSGLPEVTMPIITARSANGSFVKGIYVNNTTYAYLSMKNGDGYGKKFGDTLDANGQPDGTNGNDWLKLTIYNGSTSGDSVEFYLADFRFTDSADDYIVKDWTFVDLSSFTYPHSMLFKITSTDNDPVYGIKTPSYFCIDNMVVDPNEFTSIEENIEISFSAYPNPTTDYLTVNLSQDVTDYAMVLLDANGRLIKEISGLKAQQAVLDMTNLKQGNYFVKVIKDSEVRTKRIVKL